MPTRGLLGFRQAFLTNTRGQGIVNTLYAGYGPLAGPLTTREAGSLVAWETGVTTSFGLNNAQERGQLFLGPGVEVYEGQIVGQHIRDKDLEVNVCKKKHLTNMRNSTAEEGIRLEPPRILSLDDAIEFLAEDEAAQAVGVGPGQADEAEHDRHPAGGERPPHHLGAGGDAEPVEVERHQPDRSKIYIHALFIDRRCCGRRIADRMYFFQLLERDGAPP